MARFLSVIVVLLMFSGCATTKSTTVTETEEGGVYTSSALPVSGKLRFSDLPVPAGFKLLEDSSFVFETEDTRVALLKYSGRANQQDLLDFYKEQMLLYNWELLNIVEYEKSILNFQRSRQSCIITLESKGRHKVITVSLAPWAKSGLKETAQRK